MIRVMTSRCRFGGVAVGLVCALAMVACGGTGTVKERPVVAASAPVAKATVPPDRTAAPVLAAPTARTAQTVAAVVQVTAAPPTEAPTQAATAAATAAPVAAAAVTGGVGNGKELFTANGCIACHAADLSGGIGPKLAVRTTADLT